MISQFWVMIVERMLHAFLFFCIFFFSRRIDFSRMPIQQNLLLLSFYIVACILVEIAVSLPHPIPIPSIIALVQESSPVRMAGRALPSISQEELSQHGTPENAWVAIRGIVYDVSKFAKLHPGGRRILLEYAGKDATEAFATYHPETVLPRYANLQVGTLSSAPEAGGADGALRQPRRRRSEESEESRFGDQVPFGDPLWYQGFPVPYYRDSHKTYRALIRRFVESELKPNAQKWDEAGTYPEDLPRRAYQAGVLGATYPKEFGGTRPDDFDSFHDLIFWDELAR